MIVGSCAVLRFGQCTGRLFFPIFGHSAVQSFTAPSPSLSFHPDLHPPPLPRSRPPHSARSSHIMAIEAFLGTTAQRAYLGTSTYDPGLVDNRRHSPQKQLLSVSIRLQHPPPVANLPLIHFCRSHRCPNPRRISVQLGTVEPSLGPPSPPH